MKKITNDIVRKFGPCYDPSRYFQDEDNYTVLDVMNLKDLPFEDKLWVVLRTDFISERTMRLFAVWAYRQTLEFVKDPDPRSIEAANVAELFAKGEATQEQLNAARIDARRAARSADRSADSDAYCAAWSAAESAESAARSTDSAAWSAAYCAARSAAKIVESAKSAQENKLRELIINGIETGDTY